MLFAFKYMKIKPIYEKTIIVTFRRGSDEQRVEIVEAEWEQVHTLIVGAFRDRFRRPFTKEYVPSVKITMKEIDTVKHTSKLLSFVYTKNGNDYYKPAVMVYNISPREARIQLEKVINNNQ